MGPEPLLRYLPTLQVETSKSVLVQVLNVNQLM
jgi:hypothetical protein